MKTLVTKIIKFETAHQLTDSYSKECQNIHGHSYCLEASFEGEINCHTGMIIDFKFIKESLQDVIDKYDHKFFTKENFDEKNPTAENMAMDIFYMIRNNSKVGLMLTKVKLWETNSCCVEVKY